MSHPDPTPRQAWADLDSHDVRHVAVIGGGPAAHRCVTTLRKLGFGGAVTMVSAETIPPYDRTLLSKDNLVDGSSQIVEMATTATYDELDIEMLLGRAAVALDSTAQLVELSDGARLPYDRLVLAVGGAPVLPRALAAPGVLTLRTATDLPPIRDALERSRHLVIIGAGFIGGEIAAAAAESGAGVTLLEGLQVPLEKALGVDVGRRIAALQRASGVDLRCGVQANTVVETHSGYSVELSDGDNLKTDSVVVGVGMRPCLDWLTTSGIDIDRAIVTDSQCRTSLPRVFAVGDCAQWWSPRYGRYCHVEHWDTAGKHGASGARAVLGQSTAFDPVPFFWSDQYGVKYQWSGHAPVADTVAIDETGPGDFAARYLHGGALVGVFVANRPRQFARLRRQLMNPKEVITQ